MTDQQMLELAAKAAKAAGLDIEFDAESGKAYDENSNEWNPRDDSGEALRLAGALKLNTGFDDRFKDLGACAYCTYPTGEQSCNSIMKNIEEAGSAESATRRAVFRAAAEVGGAMP